MKISEFFKKKKKPENIQVTNTTNSIEEKEEIKENRASVYPAFDPSTLLSKDIFSDCSIISDPRNMCSNININNKNNSSISINNNSITINGKSMSFDGLDRNIKIIINNSKIDDLDVTNGELYVYGDILGDVDITNGDIKCENIAGDIDQTNGDIYKNT